jgi:hypothetical protein
LKKKPKTNPKRKQNQGIWTAKKKKRKRLKNLPEMDRQKRKRKRKRTKRLVQSLFQLAR